MHRVGWGAEIISLILVKVLSRIVMIGVRFKIAIGEVVADHCGYVTMKTRVGGNRVVDMLSGEQLPRIC